MMATGRPSFAISLPRRTCPNATNGTMKQSLNLKRTVRRVITVLLASILMSWVGGIIIKMITHICTEVHYYGYRSQQQMHSRNVSFPWVVGLTPAD